MNQLDQRYFFADGVRFACRQCGACCTGEPGAVRICEEEIIALAEGMGEEPNELKRSSLLQDGGEWRIREKPNGSCLFYDGGCTIYPFRPRQCRTWPFWVKTMRSEESWATACNACPGIGQGPLFSFGQILDLLAGTEN